MNNKILSLKKILFILFTVCVFAAFAFGYSGKRVNNVYAETSEMTVIASKETAKPDEEVDVKISFAENVGIASVKFVIYYEDFLTLESVEFNSELGGQYQTSDLTNNCSHVTLMWVNAFENYCKDGVFATLKYKVSADAADASYSDIIITYNSDDVYNKDEEDVLLNVENGFVCVDTRVAGDINDDGKVNNKDITRLFQYLAGWDVQVEKSALDVNGDGKVNNKDITRLFQYLAGWDVSANLRGPYIVTFDGNGGTLVSGKERQLIKYEGSAVAPVYSRSGYDFVGFDVDFDNVTDDLTVKAIWEETAGHTHDYIGVVTLPTCTEQGYTTYTCSVCGDVYVSDYVAPANHSESDWIVDSEPTCTTNGVKHTECTVCHATVRTVSIAATGHSYGEWSLVLMPTCTSSGTEMRVCENNGSHMETRTIKPLGHDYVVVESQNPDCTTDGYIRYVCKTCSDIKIQTVESLGHYFGDDNICDRCGYSVEIHNHNYAVNVIEPTCTSMGYTEYICSCGASYRSEFIEPLGHKYREGVIINDKTCYENGTLRYTCVRCGNVLDEAIIAAHEWSDTVVTEKTCTEDGVTYKYCTVCGMEDVVIIPASHEWNDGVVITTATCTEKGSKEVTCSVCGQSEIIDIPAIGHEFRNGICIRCGEKFINVVAPDPEHPEYGMYFLVDEIKSDYGPELINEYGVLLYVNAGAKLDKVGVYLTQDGTMWRRCIACTGEDIEFAVYVPYLSYGTDILYTGLNSSKINTFALSKGADGIWRYSEYATIGVNLADYKGNLLLSLYDIGQAGAKTMLFDDLNKMKAWLKGEDIDKPHVHTEVWNDEIPATCLKNGYTAGSYCSVCGEIIVPREIIYAPGHEYVATVIQPTCTDMGYTVYICQNCGDSYKDNYVSALGHNYGDWYVVKESSCLEEGIERRVCANDASHVEIRHIDKLAHIESDWIVDIESTCTGKGSKHIECTVCGTIILIEEIEPLGHYFVNNMCMLCGGNKSVEPTAMPAEYFNYIYLENTDSYQIIQVNSGNYNSYLGKVVVPAEYNGKPITSIGSQLKYHGISIILLPNSFTQIDSGEFYEFGFESIVIPKSVKSIGSGAFLYSGLKKVYYKGDVEEWNNITIGSNDCLNKANIYYYSKDYPKVFEKDTYWYYLDGEPTIWTEFDVDEPDDGKLKIGLITLHDRYSSYDTIFIDAIERIAENYDLEPDQVIIRTEIPEGGKCYETCIDLVNLGCDIIISDSFGHESFMLKAAKEYPDVQFIAMTGVEAVTEQLSNFHNSYGAFIEGEYLEGIAAGLKLNELLESNQIQEDELNLGIIAGWPYAECISRYTAFYLGAKSVCPNVKAYVTFTYSWYDYDCEKCAAIILKNNYNCKILTSCVSVENGGSSALERYCDSLGPDSVYYTGMYSDTDLYLLGYEYDAYPYFEYVMDCVINGQTISADWIGNIENGSIIMLPYGKYCDSEAIEQAKSELINGTRDIFVTSEFIVNGEHLTSYLANVVADDYFVGETEAIYDGVFLDCYFRSQSYFDLFIDGIIITDNQYPPVIIYDDVLKVGMECHYEPFNWTQEDDSNGAVKIANMPGYANGYDVMIAKKIAEALNLKLEIYAYDWDSLIPAVYSGALDLIIAGMSPTDERRVIIDFTANYYESNIVVVVRKDGEYANAQSLADLSGATIVAMAGTFYVTYLDQIVGVQHQTYEDFPKMIDALGAGEVDGFIAEEPFAISVCMDNEEFTYVKLKNNEDGFTITDLSDFALAIGINKNSALLRSINAILAEISEEERDYLMRRAIELGYRLSHGEENPSDDDDEVLTVGYDKLNGSFDPFESDGSDISDGDQAVIDMTSVYLVTTDRGGAIVYKGKTGETIRYNGMDYVYSGIADVTVTENADGTVYYDFNLREDVYFSDGVNLTADDVIFSMYVLADPTYNGSLTFADLSIEGLDAYRNNMVAKWRFIINDLRYDTTENKDSGYYTDADKAAFETAFAVAGERFAQSIVDYCINNYSSYGAYDVSSSANLWGFDIGEGATAADFWQAIFDFYGYEPEEIDFEAAEVNFTTYLSNELSSDLLKGVGTGAVLPNITGIQKTGKYSVRVVVTTCNAVDIYSFIIPVAPMHYYGDLAEYNYSANKFGFEKGDLSSITAKRANPLGAGAYVLKGFENGTVSFEANELYYLGTPDIERIEFVGVNGSDFVAGVLNSEYDVVTSSSIKVNNLYETLQNIKYANENYSLSGDTLVAVMYDVAGHGYIGMSAHKVKVGDDGSSEASKNLRKALATVFAAYRELSVLNYYGERAYVINYPISNTSWAALLPADEGYEIAFSKDAYGNQLYAAYMSAEERYAAALRGALTFFEAAGYTVENGRVTAAPAGGRLEFEALIPADGAGDHPSFQLLQEAAKALKTIGINLIVTDLANSSELWDTINADQADIWCAAWGASVDPDMYQIYFSGEEGKEAGGSNYMYDIDDARLNELILAARNTTDMAQRKLIYRECLEIILDWAIEIPVYQRIDNKITIFSAERINVDTIASDITVYYSWIREIEKLEANSDQNPGQHQPIDEPEEIFSINSGDEVTEYVWNRVFASDKFSNFTVSGEYINGNKLTTAIIYVADNEAYLFEDGILMQAAPYESVVATFTAFAAAYKDAVYDAERGVYSLRLDGTNFILSIKGEYLTEIIADGNTYMHFYDYGTTVYSDEEEYGDTGEYEIIDFSIPMEQTLREKRATDVSVDSESKFYTSGDISLIVGTDNEFLFLPEMKVYYDKSGTTQVKTDYAAETSMLYIEGDTYLTCDVDEEESIASYYLNGNLTATFKYCEGKYKFENYAVGKTLVLFVYPKDVEYSEPVILAIKAVEGYNVYDAKDLGIIDNTTSKSWTNKDVWADIRKEKGWTINQINATKAIILQRDISVTYADLPEEYVGTIARDIVYYNFGDYTTPANVAISNKRLMHDDDYQLNVYERNTSDNFTVYGNYYTIDLSELPLTSAFEEVAIERDENDNRKSISGYGSDYSNSVFIKIKNEKSNNRINFNVNNLNVIGNSGTEQYVTFAESDYNKYNPQPVYAGGIVLIKASTNCDVTFENSTFKRTHICYLLEYNSKLNANHVKIFDSFQNAGLIWGECEMTITNSVVKRAGGSLFILMHVRPEENPNSNIPKLYVSNSVLENYVTGQELWFESVGATPVFSQIKQVTNEFLNGVTSSKKTISKTVSNNDCCNLICMVMSNATSASGIISPSVQGYCSVTQDGTTYVLDRLSTSDLGIGIRQMLYYGTVTFNADDGGFFYLTDSSSVSYQPINKDLAETCQAFIQGEYVSMNYGGIGLMFETYEKSNDNQWTLCY